MIIVSPQIIFMIQSITLTQRAGKYTLHSWYKI